jgi:putative aminopeptidase FrvX
MDTVALSLLSALTEAHGVPGHENAVRQIFQSELSSMGPIVGDALGSLACERPGHFDEVGFAVQSITARGFIKFVPLGGWWSHALVAQRVRILTRSGHEILGVIGSTPPHFLAEAQRDKLQTIEQMTIDIGATSREEAESWGVALGDPIAPESQFTPMAGNGLYMAKAFDNRCGIAATIQSALHLLPTPLPCTLIAAGSAQEEVGCRGAHTLAALTRPSIALILEGTPADDTHGMDIQEAQGALGGGVQIRLLDPTALMHRGLVDFAVHAAREAGIPYQIAVRRSGGTDAKSIQLHHLGVPCVVLGTPARYIHSHNSIIQLADYIATVNLVCAMAQRLDATTYSRILAGT